jgi:ribosome maturation factor RimP
MEHVLLTKEDFSKEVGKEVWMDLDTSLQEQSRSVGLMRMKGFREERNQILVIVSSLNHNDYPFVFDPVK